MRIFISTAYNNNDKDNNDKNNNHYDNNNEKYNEYHRKTVTSQHTSYVNNFHVKQMFKKTVGSL